MKSASNRLLVVDDEAGIRKFFSIVAKQIGYEVRAAGNEEEFAAEVENFNPTALILDLNMPGSGGVEMLQYLAKERSEAQVIVISGADTRVLDAAERLGSSQGLQMAGVLRKPMSLRDLEAALNSMMSKTVTEVLTS